MRTNKKAAVAKLLKNSMAISFDVILAYSAASRPLFELAEKSMNRAMSWGSAARMTIETAKIA